MTSEFKIIEANPQPALAIREEVFNQEIGKKMGELFGELMEFFMRKRIQVTSPPFTIYHSWNSQKTVMEVGFPVASPMEGEGRIRYITLPSGKVATGYHVGPYERLMESYQKLQDWMKEKGLKPVGINIAGIETWPYCTAEHVAKTEAFVAF